MVETIYMKVGCPTDTLFFAMIGKIVVFLAIYSLIAVFVSQIILAILGKRYSELDSNKQSLVILGAIFWPIAIVVSLVWWVVEALALPFTAARKRDLRKLDKEVKAQIAKCLVVPSQEPVTKFKVGELITGIRGNPDNYNHLNEGCVCRVISIDEEGKMKVVLVDHKDFNGHKDVIGNVFKAPARNFVKCSKRKPSKAKKR